MRRAERWRLRLEMNVEATDAAFLSPPDSTPARLTYGLGTVERHKVQASHMHLTGRPLTVAELVHDGWL